MIEPGLRFPDTIEISFRMRFVGGSSRYIGRAPAAVFVTTSPNVGPFCISGATRSSSPPKASPGAGRRTQVSIRILHFTTIYFKLRARASAAWFPFTRDNHLVLSGVSFARASAHGGIRRIGFGEVSTLAFGTSEWQSFSHNSALSPSRP